MRMRCIHILAASIVLLATTSAQARSGPYTPAHADVVLKQLPTSTGNVKIRQLHQQLADTPCDSILANQLALLYINKGKAESDPRYFGYAQSALSPWWDLAEPPPSVRLLRAVLNQQQHQFSAAINDLKALVRLDRTNAQA